MSANNNNKVIGLTILVAALGYFVDVYDLVLFLIVGKTSLANLYPEWSEKIIGENFTYLLDIQMIGMLIGGVFWGVLGDKKGRLSVLFGSILTYSLANIANAFATDLNTYAILRFVAGFGLAGELGAGITLVSESMDKEKRGYGTMLVAAIGVVGAVVAGLLSEFVTWKTSYLIGGGLGLSLLLLRIGVFESGMFEKSKNDDVKHGDFFQFFRSKERLIRFINSILIGLPVWFIIGFLISKDGINISKLMGITDGVKQNFLVLFCYAGLVFGDVMSGTLSQVLRSRKKAITIFYIMIILMVITYLNVSNISSTVFYMLIFGLGFSVGFWALFVTNASEQFGTNLRSTAANTIPNFIRGSVPLIGLLFGFLYNDVFDGNLINTYLVLTVIIMSISAIALYFLKETFGKDMDYLER